MLALEIFVWTFGGILFTPQDMLCRINSRLIFKMNFFHKKCNEFLRQLLNLHLKILHIKRGMDYYFISMILIAQAQWKSIRNWLNLKGLWVQSPSGTFFLKNLALFLQF